MSQPDLPASRRCRGETCRAEIIFLPTSAGKTIPIDPTPTPDGNIRIATDLLGEPVAHVLGRTVARSATEPLYVPHWATCPDVEEFRHG